MRKRNPIRRRRDSEDGYMLLAVIFMLFLVTIALSVAIPDMTKSIQRDHELETMHRGKQYIRAIQLYYRKFHAYPPSIDALVNTNNVRFLRKRYLDPITGKDDWKPIYFGQNKQPLAFGFFGQPLAGLSGAMPVAGTGPGGTGGMPGAGFGQNGDSGFGTAGGTFGSTGSSFGSSFGGNTGSSAGGSSLFGSSDSGSNSTDNNATGTAAGAAGSGTDNSGNSANGSGSGSNSTGSGTGSGVTNGQVIGGGGIIGVEPVSPKQSILLYKKQDHYNQWEFTYSPLQDMKQPAGMGGTANTGLNGSAGMPGSGGTGFGSGFGSSFGGSTGGFGSSAGSSGGFGSSQSPSPQQPQQQ